MCGFFHFYDSGEVILTVLFENVELLVEPKPCRDIFHVNENIF